MFKSNVYIKLLLSFSIFLLTACGHDGDDNDFVASAIIDTKVRPTIIDTGDRTQVTIETSQIHEQGVLLKVRFEKTLKYVPESSYIAVRQDDMKENVTPILDESDERYTYLVFFLSRAQFGQDNEGKVIFELKGIKSQKNATVEVDPDVDDPGIPNDQEFNVINPEFSPDTVSYVTIR